VTLSYLSICSGIEAATDQKRGKALGNSMAVPCINWIGARLAQVHNFDLQRREIHS
jgi:site-specific DNA-cytosine methylase